MRGLITQHNTLHYAAADATKTICGNSLDNYTDPTWVELAIEAPPSKAYSEARIGIVQIVTGTKQAVANTCNGCEQRAVQEKDCPCCGGHGNVRVWK